MKTYQTRMTSMMSCKKDKLKTILVVDDEDMVLQFVKDVIEDLGYIILLSTNAEDALAILKNKNGKIDLLLTDIILPTMKGHELGKLTSEEYPEMKILYMSGYISPAIPDELIKNNQQSFIQKPLNHFKLSKEINRLLQ